MAADSQPNVEQTSGRLRSGESVPDAQRDSIEQMRDRTDQLSTAFSNAAQINGS